MAVPNMAKVGSPKKPLQDENPAVRYFEVEAGGSQLEGQLSGQWEPISNILKRRRQVCSSVEALDSVPSTREEVFFFKLFCLFFF